jgi:cholest-4-en-3-one 26-monooxygenase
VAGPDIPPGFDFTDPDLYARRVPSEEFAELRRTQPVWWNAQRRGSAGFDDEGFWAVTRHADIIDVSKRSEVYSSWENTALIRFDESIERDAIEMQRVILLNMDPPQQTKVRAIVSRGFTPRSITNMRGNLQQRAERIVATALAEGTGDFVTDVACELPLQAIAELIGVPQEDRKKIFEWSNKMIGYDDPEFADEGTMAAMELLSYAMEMAELRKVEPRDDIVTKLVNAEIDGEQLDSDEFGYFVLMLAVAGNETTRNAISHGMQAFFEHPDQWELFKSERPETTADEIIRWGTPVTVFQRTAIADTELGGQQIKRGQRVGLFYRSGNFDETVFDHPERFDIKRDPNPHLGLGGFGAHYCLGASLAKLEIGLIFNAIADAMPDIRQAGDPERLRSGWLNGIKRLPVSYG